MAVPAIPGMPLPNLTGGKGGDAAPSGATGGGLFDSSGWNVNFGSGSIDGGLSKYLPYVALAAGVMVVWRMTKRR